MRGYLNDRNSGRDLFKIGMNGVGTIPILASYDTIYVALRAVRA